MISVAALRRKLLARREVARQQEFEAWQYQRRLRDVVTEQAEILATPMCNTFRYTLGPEGLTSDLHEPLPPIFERGYERARQLAAIDPAWRFERERRRIEKEEYYEVEDFAAQDPEAAIAITSMTLDRSDYQGMQAIASNLGYDLPEGLGSEEILARRLWLGDPPQALVVLSPYPDAIDEDGVQIGGYNPQRRKLMVRVVTRDADFHDDLLNTVRNSYDAALTRQYGGAWYAGRPPIAHTDAKGFVERQTDLLADHMAIVQRVFAAEKDYDVRRALLAEPTYNLSAALDERLHDPDAADPHGAGDRARKAGKTFEPECPDGVDRPPSTASQLEALGYLPGAGRIDKCVSCPFCRRRGIDAETKPGKNPRTGKVTLTYQCLKKSGGCGAMIDKKTGERIDRRPKHKQIGMFATFGAQKSPTNTKNRGRQ